MAGFSAPTLRRWRSDDCTPTTALPRQRSDDSASTWVLQQQRFHVSAPTMVLLLHCMYDIVLLTMLVYPMTARLMASAPLNHMDWQLLTMSHTKEFDSGSSVIIIYRHRVISFHYILSIACKRTSIIYVQFYNGTMIGVKKRCRAFHVAEIREQ